MRSVLVKKFDNRVLFPIICLFSACFNDVLRLGESKVTLFRLLAVFGLLKCLSVKKNTIKYIGILFFFTLISFIQSLFFYITFKIGIEFSLTRFILYDYFYICIFVTIWLLELISKYVNEKSLQVIHFLIITVSILYLFNLFVIWGYPDIRSYVLLNNQNDYGAMLAATLPLIICDYQNKKKKGYILFALLISFILIAMDCKLSLLGVFVQLGILCVLFIKNKINFRNLRVFIIIPFFVIVILICLLVGNADISFHGYTLKQTVVEPINHILKGEMYNQNNTSVSYRVNVMIVGMKWMAKSKFLGIGVGNTGVLLRSILGEQNLYDKWLKNDAISPHNALVEVLLEFGGFAVILIIMAFFSVLKLLKKEKLSNEEIAYVSFFVSSLLWLQGPSGIVTDYYIFIIFTYMIIKNKRKGAVNWR